MPLVPRHYCTRCKNSVFNVIIDGQRVPLVLVMNTGQPVDTGVFDANGPGVKLPSFVREMLQTPNAIVELCMLCVAEIFNVPLVTAAEDPMYDVNNDGLADALQLNDPKLSVVERAHLMHTRSFHAILVGQGRATVQELPAEFLPQPKPKAEVDLSALTAEELEAELARRASAPADA